MKKCPCHRSYPSETQSSPISRRDFLKLAGTFVGGLALASCTPAATPTTTPSPSQTIIPSVTPKITPSAPASATVAIIKAESYDPKLVRQQVQAALDAIGGVGDIIRPGDSVAIKVNMVGGTCCDPLPNHTRIETYWTHPQVVQALGELLRDAGAKKLYILEYVDQAYYEVSKSLQALLVDVEESRGPYYTAPVGTTGGLIYESFKFDKVLGNVDAFVSVPKMKCHSTLGVTLSMKNLVGLGPSSVYHGAKPDDPGKFSFHTGPDGQEDPKVRLPRVIVDLNRARPINLALVDGITTTDGGEGPWCKSTHFQTPHVLIAGKNPLATDAVAAAVMGFEPTGEYPNAPFVNAENYMNIARSVGLGTNRLEEIEVKGVSIESVRQKFAPSL